MIKINCVPNVLDSTTLFVTNLKFLCQPVDYYKLTYRTEIEICLASPMLCKLPCLRLISPLWRFQIRISPHQPMLVIRVDLIDRVVGLGDLVDSVSISVDHCS